MPRGLFRGGLRRDEISFQAKLFKAMNGVLWVLWTLLKNGIFRLLAGFDTYSWWTWLGVRYPNAEWSRFVIAAVTRSRLSHPL